MTRPSILEAAKRHREEDRLRKQTYGYIENGQFRGGSVGCFARDFYPDMSIKDFERLDKHRIVADSYGYPVWLVHLQDAVFEGLPVDEALDWHVQLATAIEGLPDDYDWRIRLHRIHAAIQRIAYRTAGKSAAAVQRVLDLHEKAMRGETVDADDWSAAESAAESAASSTIWSAPAGSAAWSADWSAARSAGSAARSAAGSAGSANAYREIRDGVLAAISETAPRQE